MDPAIAAKISPGCVKPVHLAALHSVVGRAVVYVPVAIAAWWFLLKGPSLWLLRSLAWLPLAILVAPSNLDPVRVDPDTHEWVFNVAVNTVLTNPQTGARQRISSVEFAANEDNLAFFAFGWFSYLALALSAREGFSTSQTKGILRGLGLQTAVNVLSLAAYVFINGYGSLVNTPHGPPSAVWFYEYAYYLVYLVLPFVGPFAVGLLMHPEWRALFMVQER